MKVSPLGSAQQESTGVAINRYYASKMRKPRATRTPTVFYRVGDNMRTEQEVIFERSPQRPINVTDEAGHTRLSAPAADF